MNRTIVILLLALSTVVLLGTSWTSAIDGRGQFGRADESLIATVGVGDYPHGVAVSENTNRVYVANLLADDVARSSNRILNWQPLKLYRAEFAVAVLDARTNAIVGKVTVGTNPWSVAVNEATNRIYVANHDGDSLSVVDGETDELLYSIEVGRAPMFVAVSEATGRVYVTNAGDDTVSVIAPLSHRALKLTYH